MLVLDSYLLIKIGRIRIARGWSGKRLVMKCMCSIIDMECELFVRVSLRCWGEVIVGIGAEYKWP